LDGSNPQSTDISRVCGAPDRFNSPPYYYKAEDFTEMTDAARVFYTAGLMDGFYASVLFGATDKTVANLHLCTKDMDSKQVSAIITKYLKDHPESWHLPLSVEAHNALNAACPGVLKVVN
jgi:hypothetical protein